MTTSALASLPVQVLRRVIVQLDTVSLSDLLTAVGDELSESRWLMVMEEHCRVVETLPARACQRTLRRLGYASWADFMSQYARGSRPRAAADGEEDRRTVFATLLPEMQLEIARHLDTLSMHSLIHALRPARDLLPLLRMALLEEAVRERRGPLMHWAADIGCVECYLSLRNESDSSRHSLRGTTPLIAAAQSGHEEIVRLLLTEYGYSDSERHAETAETALLLACDGGHKAIAEMLLQWGAHPENHDSKGRIALSVAACRSHTDIMSMLINHEEVDINAAPGVCWGSALDAAVDSGQIAAIKLLLAAGAHPRNTGWGPGNTISTFERALRYRGNKYRSFLAAKNNDRNNPRLLRQPPITVADAAATRLTMLSILCAHGVDLNTVYGRRADSVMHRVAYTLTANAVRLLAGQNMGALNTPDTNGTTPLHTAADFANRVADLDTFAALMDAGADWAARDAWGCTPLDLTGAVWFEAYGLVAAQRRKDRRSRGWWLWWWWCWREGEVWEGVAYYTWLRALLWVGLQWGVPLLVAFENVWPVQHDWAWEALERCQARAEMVAERVADLVETGKGSVPAVMAARLVNRVMARVARMKKCVVRVLNNARGLRVHRSTMGRFNRRFWWRVIFGGLFLAQLLLVGVLNLARGLDVGAVWAGPSAVCIENRRHWVSPASTHLQATGAHIVAGGCPSWWLLGGCEVGGISTGLVWGVKERGRGHECIFAAAHK